MFLRKAQALLERKRFGKTCIKKDTFGSDPEAVKKLFHTRTKSIYLILLLVFRG